MRTNLVSFENRGFCIHENGETPRGLDATEFFIAQLQQRGINARYDDFADFYAHLVDCRIGRWSFTLTIGFVGNELLLIDVDDWLPHVLSFIGIRSDSERLQLLHSLDNILHENGFHNIKWWTTREWRGAQRAWSTSPK